MQIDGYQLSIDQVWQVAHGLNNEEVVLSSDAKERVKASRDYILSRIENGDVM